MPKVTIIMPSLNVAKYIKPCMDSVLSQSLQDIEVLAVDAGSTDGTLEILEEYAVRDKRVRVLVSDRRSYGYQMNLGLQNATGEYVGVVETDDIIVEDMYETLYETACESDADYVKGQGAMMLEFSTGAIWMDNDMVISGDASFYGVVVKPCDMPELLTRDYYLWTGIYKRDFLEGVRFNDTPGAAFQDIGFLLQVFSKAKRAVYLKKRVYLYRQDNMNASVKNWKGFRYLWNEDDFCKSFWAGLSEEWRSAVCCKLLFQTRRRFQTMVASGSFWEEAEEDMNTIGQRLQDALSDGYLSETELTADEWKLLHMVIENPRLVYEWYSELYGDKKLSLERFLEPLKGQEVIVFGCGRWGRYLHAIIESRKLGNVIAYCDNQAELWGSVLQGTEVLSPQEAVSVSENAKLVIANKYHAEEIKEQLLGLGMSEDKMLIYTLGVELDLLIF